MTSRSKVSLVLLLVALSGCAGFQANRQGNSKLADGDVVGGLAKLRLATEQAPENIEYRRDYFLRREAVVNGLLRKADAAIAQAAFSTATEAYQQVLAVDTGNAQASAGLERVAVASRHKRMLDGAEALARQPDGLTSAIARVRSVASEDPTNRRADSLLRELSRQALDASGREQGMYPRLRESFRKPVTMSLSNASLQQAFEILKMQTGLNFMFDKDVRTDARTSISVQNKPVEDVLRLLLASNQLDRRILDDDSVLIYPNTPQKAAEYREMVIRSFYLSNADVTKTATLIKTLLKTKDVFVDEKLNMIMIRDSAEVVRLAGRLIANQDLVEPEVMLELEVLEISASKLTELGIRWPDSLSASVGGANGAGQITLPEFQNRNSGLVNLQFSDPLISARLHDDRGDTTLLANPRIRVKNRQTAKVLIGERVPVITSLATANVGTSQSVNYLDVGLKLEIEPGIALDGDVSMKIALEVSSILETIRTTGGTQAYRLGTRNASTSLRVRDGETQILAGLIQRDERRSKIGIPGINAIPLLNRLFGSTSDSATKTEIVLLITPRVVRNIDVPGPGQIELLSGTESSLGAAPIQLGVSSAPNGAQAGVTGQPPSSNVPGTLPPGMRPPVILAPPPPTVPVPMPMPVPASPPVQGPAPVVPVYPEQGIQPGGLTAPPLVPTSPGSNN